MSHANSDSLTKFLTSIKCNQTVYPTSVGRVKTDAHWNPNVQWNGTDVQGTFFERYGFYNQGIPDDKQPANPNRYSAGDYVGEALSGSGGGLDSGILQAIRTVIGDPNFTPVQQDLMDLRVVKDPSVNDAVYNTRIKPQIRRTA